MSDRPNFLLFITDQHRADHLGCYGNDIVQTPNIDSLAARGTRFDRFYVACPICMPNRATLMTGRMPSLHGVRQNGIPLSLDATSKKLMPSCRPWMLQPLQRDALFLELRSQPDRRWLYLQGTERGNRAGTIL